MTTIKTALEIPATATDSDVTDLFAQGTTPSSHTWFKAIRCLVNTVTKLDSDSRKLGLKPETDGVLVYKKSVAGATGKARTEWGFDIGDFYVTYKSALSSKSRIMKGDEIIFEGAWPELKGFLRPETPTQKKPEVKIAAAPVVETPAPAPSPEPEEKIVQNEAPATEDKEDEDEIEFKENEDDRVEALIADLNGDNDDRDSDRFGPLSAGNGYWDDDEAERLGVVREGDFDLANY